MRQYSSQFRKAQGFLEVAQNVNRRLRRRSDQRRGRGAPDPWIFAGVGRLSWRVLGTEGHRSTLVASSLICRGPTTTASTRRAYTLFRKKVCKSKRHFHD